MENPYEAPATQQQARETWRSLWSRRLQCPHCQNPGVSVGRAWLAHPHFRVRCDHCRKPSRVKMSATAVKREVINLFAAVTRERRMSDSTARTETRFTPSKYHVCPSESQSAERLSYVGDVAPPTRIPATEFTTNDATRLKARTFVDESALNRDLSPTNASRILRPS